MEKLIVFVISFLFICILSQSCLSGNTKRETDKNSTLVNNNNVHIDYNDNGEGKFCLLFIHGWCIDKEYWSSQFDFFSKNYRVVTIDLPGYGKSGKNRSTWTIDEYGHDIGLVIRQLGLTNVILIGHSMGGAIAIRAALQNPEQVIGYIGVDNGKDAGKEPDEETKKAFREVFRMFRNDFKGTARWYASSYLLNEQTDSLIRERVIHDHTTADSSIAISGLEDYAWIDTRAEIDRLKRLRMRIFLVNSDYSPTDTLGYIQNQIPFTLLTLRATSHFPMIETPTVFNQVLENAIRRIVEGNQLSLSN